MEELQLMLLEKQLTTKFFLFWGKKAIFSQKMAAPSKSCSPKYVYWYQCFSVWKMVGAKISVHSRPAAWSAQRFCHSIDSHYLCMWVKNDTIGPHPLTLYHEWQWLTNGARCINHGELAMIRASTSWVWLIHSDNMVTVQWRARLYDFSMLPRRCTVLWSSLFLLWLSTILYSCTMLAPPSYMTKYNYTQLYNLWQLF